MKRAFHSSNKLLTIYRYVEGYDRVNEVTIELSGVITPLGRITIKPEVKPKEEKVYKKIMSVNTTNWPTVPSGTVLFDLLTDKLLALYLPAQKIKVNYEEYVNKGQVTTIDVGTMLKLNNNRFGEYARVEVKINDKGYRIDLRDLDGDDDVDLLELFYSDKDELLRLSASIENELPSISFALAETVNYIYREVTGYITVKVDGKVIHNEEVLLIPVIELGPPPRSASEELRYIILQGIKNRRGTSE